MPERSHPNSFRVRTENHGPLYRHGHRRDSWMRSSVSLAPKWSVCLVAGAGKPLVSRSLFTCSPCIPLPQAGFMPPMAGCMSPSRSSGCGSSMPSVPRHGTGWASPSRSPAWRSSCSPPVTPDLTGFSQYIEHRLNRCSVSWYASQFSTHIPSPPLTKNVDIFCSLFKDSS